MNESQTSTKTAPAAIPPTKRDLRDLRKTIWPLLIGKGEFHFHSNKMDQKVKGINVILFCHHHKKEALEVFQSVVVEKIDRNSTVDYTTMDIGGQTGTLLKVTIS